MMTPMMLASTRRRIFCFAVCEIAVGMCKRQRALLLGFEQARVFDRDHRLVGEGFDKRDLLVKRTVGPPFAVLEILRRDTTRNNGVASVVRWPSRFALFTPHRVLAALSAARSWTWMSSTITCRASGHRVSVYGNGLVGRDYHWNFPV